MDFKVYQGGLVITNWLYFLIYEFGWKLGFYGFTLTFIIPGFIPYFLFPNWVGRVFWIGFLNGLGILSIIFGSFLFFFSFFEREVYWRLF